MVSKARENSRRGSSNAFLKVLLFSIFLVRIFTTPVSAQTPTRAQSLTSVVTYHNDPQRTGWNPNETILTPANVNAQSFFRIRVVQLDGQVDAQPLVVPANQQYQSRGIDSVVYVVTENNTVYAINGSNGDVLLQRNLGAPMMTVQGPPSDPYWCTPQPAASPRHTHDRLGLPNPVRNGSNGSGSGLQAPDYHNISSMLLIWQPWRMSWDRLWWSKLLRTWKMAHNFAFNALYQRQRPALLENLGQIYAAFGSFADCYTNLSRGWVLGWDSSLSPLPMNELTNQIPRRPFVFQEGQAVIRGSPTPTSCPRFGCRATGWPPTRAETFTLRPAIHRQGPINSASISTRAPFALLPSLGA